MSVQSCLCSMSLMICQDCDRMRLLFADPIVWALAEGTNYISANVEVGCTDACWHPAHLVARAAACTCHSLHGLTLTSSVLLAQHAKSYYARLQTYCYAVLDVTAKIGFGAVIIGSNNRLMESYGVGRWVLLCWNSCWHLRAIINYDFLASVKTVTCPGL